MTIKYSIKTAANGLRTNKSRAALTILGIVIGITSIILVMSVGQGATNLILSQIQGLGSKTIAILPGRSPSGPSDVAQLFSDSLKEKDLELIKRKENVPTLDKIMPVVFGSETASYGSETYRLTIFGATELMSTILNAVPQTGIFFIEDDVRGKSDVIVIGSTVKEKLFGTSDAIGERIKIKGKNFRVIGIFPKKGQVSFFNFDEMAVMPYTTAQDFILGIKYFNRLIAIAASDATVDRTVSDLTITLRNSHNITDPAKDDFSIQTPKDIANTLGTITSVLTILLTSIAAISLLVGGIGIMNIMLVSVTERTREIGLRKAVGATGSDIMKQFLIESVMLTGIGGIIGIILGAVFSFLISIAISNYLEVNWLFTFPYSAAALGISVAAGIGLVFGIYPARKASLKSPIEALRYE
ncbi:MAG TPA: ABC transporter permease [Candidatus Paceibacterota bacterium]